MLTGISSWNLTTGGRPTGYSYRRLGPAVAELVPGSRLGLEGSRPLSQ
jgi:hypothetical protein